MSDSNIFFTIQFEDNAVSLPEALELEQSIVEIGRTRLRQYTGPASDGGTTLITIIEFIGQNAVAGLIGAGTLTIFNLLKDKFAKFLQRDPEEIHRHRFFDKIVIRFDDLDICIFMADNKMVEQLPIILDDVGKHLQKHPLKDSSTNEIYIPMERIGTNWRTPSSIWSRSFPIYPCRYWRVTSRDVTGNFGIYDTEQHLIIGDSMSDEDFLQVLLDSPRPAMIGRSSQLVQYISSIKPNADQNALDKLVRDVECLSYLLGIDTSGNENVDFETLNQLVSSSEWFKTFKHPTEALNYLSSHKQL